jgi:TonB-dependent starch-binding outer membrane protein SusC
MERIIKQLLKPFMKRFYLLFIPVIFILISFSLAYYHRVSGTITGVAGNPIVNAIIKEKGKNNKKIVTTDPLGKYSMKVSSANAILVISSFRYATTEVEVKGRKIVNLILQPAQLEPHDQPPQKN